VTKKVKKFPDPLVFACKDGFPMTASDSSVGGNADQVAKIQVGNRALNAAQGRLKP